MSGPTEVQPYYRAYMHAEGATDSDALFARTGSNAPYIAWVGAQWRRFFAERGIPGYPTPLYREEFAAWLAAQFPGPAAAEWWESEPHLQCDHCGRRKSLDSHGAYLGESCYHCGAGSFRLTMPTDQTTPTNEETSNMRQPGEFHTRNGLTFRRNDDGSVRVRLYPNGMPDEAPTFDLTLHEQEWESILYETAFAAVHRRPADAIPEAPDAR